MVKERGLQRSWEFGFVSPPPVTASPTAVNVSPTARQRHGSCDPRCPTGRQPRPSGHPRLSKKVPFRPGTSERKSTRVSGSPSPLASPMPHASIILQYNLALTVWPIRTHRPGKRPRFRGVYTVR